MPNPRWLLPVSVPVLALAVAISARPSSADTVELKNGTVLHGTVDRDNTIYFIFDGLKRTILRDSKIQTVKADAAFRNLEVFKLEQPLVVHAGAMPKEVLKVNAEPWNDRGRRMFEYLGANLRKPVRMEQAINELGPQISKIRGVDGFWQGQLATRAIPKEVVLGLLARVDRKNINERRRVYSFLVQAEWYAEAKAELDRLVADFPDLREQVENARAAVARLEAVQMRAEIDVLRKAKRFREAEHRLRTFPGKDVAADLLAEVRDQLRQDDAQAAADNALADALRRLADRLPESSQKEWSRPLLEVLRALKEAPDAVRDRFTAWRKAEDEGTRTDAEKFALALSGYVIGPDAAVPDLSAAANLWKARDLVQSYLSSEDSATRADLVEKLNAVELPDEPAQKASTRRLDVVTRLARLAPPPLHAEGVKPGEVGLRRVPEDQNEVPTEYAVFLPPEYHPLRSYPAVVALHSGAGPESALAWCSAEAARRGYIVIAPQYNLPGEAVDYHYSPSEHAAVELSLRDARRRYAIDADRVFLCGQLNGGHMAWDYGLAHPDAFAGVAVVSGLPLKYVVRYMDKNGDRLPLYVALGDLAPASNEVVFGQLVRPLIAKGDDVTYVEHFKRGLEELPEEAPAVFDWMDHRPSREPYPKDFDFRSARESDNRFYGVVVHEFAEGRTTAPAAVDPAGKNLNPATIKFKSSTLTTPLLMNFTVSGLRRFDVWVPPRFVDVKKRLEVRVNGRSMKIAPKPSLEPLLEDLRMRGDRQQVYWLKVPVQF
jgi:acetyl esterase/lipase